MVYFKFIEAHNWKKCINLPILEEEKDFICPNVHSIAEAQFYPKAISRAIYNADNDMVGYTMFGEDEDNSELFYLDRLMISSEHRGCGYGKDAIRVVQIIAFQSGYKKVAASTELENTKMRSLLSKLNFYTLNEIDNTGEIIYYYDLSNGI